MTEHPAEDATTLHLPSALWSEQHAASTKEAEIAAFRLAGRNNMVQGASIDHALTPRVTTRPGVLMRSTLVQASVASVVTTLSLIYGAGGGQRLFYPNVFSLSDAKPASALVGIALLFAVPFLQMIGGSRIPTAIQTVIATASTAMAAVLLEYSALKWPTNSAPLAIEVFMKGNAFVLCFAILLAILSARAIRLSYPARPLPLPVVGSPDPTTRLSIGWEQE